MTLEAECDLVAGCFVAFFTIVLAQYLVCFCEDRGVVVLWLNGCDVVGNLLNAVAGVFELIVEYVLVVVYPLLQAC